MQFFIVQFRSYRMLIAPEIIALLVESTCLHELDGILYLAFGMRCG